MHSARSLQWLSFMVLARLQHRGWPWLAYRPRHLLRRLLKRKLIVVVIGIGIAAAALGAVLFVVATVDVVVSDDDVSDGDASEVDVGVVSPSASSHSVCDRSFKAPVFAGAFLQVVARRNQL